MAKNLIKKLQTSFPRSAPFDSRQLAGVGISNDLANQYVRSGWLIRLGRGVFMHAGDQLLVDSCLVFLESRIEGLHLAGRSALSRHGFRQNLATSETLILWGTPNASIPEWFSELFAVRYSHAQIFDGSWPNDKGLTRLPDTLGGPLLADPERALIEMLSEVGRSQELEEAKAIMESMRHLRVSWLCKLIESCKMVKAVRLCALWADELGLPWAAKVAGAIPSEMMRHRWVGRMRDGQTLTLPALNARSMR